MPVRSMSRVRRWPRASNWSAGSSGNERAKTGADRPRDWAQMAAGAGYFDRSHLIREFRQLAGMAPGAYAPVQADQPTHVALAR